MPIADAGPALGRLGEDAKGRCVTDPIDAASGLEYLRRAGVHVRRAVEDGAVLFRWVAVGVGKVMVPTCCCGSETAKLIPARRMRACGKANSRDKPSVADTTRRSSEESPQEKAPRRRTDVCLSFGSRART